MSKKKSKKRILTPMPKSVLADLVQVCKIQSHSSNEKLMTIFLASIIVKMELNPIIDGVGNILVTKGKAKTYPCVVCHIDTVHRFVNEYQVFSTVDKDKHTILFAQDGDTDTGIGGDDKCGVFTCLYMLKHIPNIKVVFFTQEESGCVGAKGIDKKFFKDVRYIIESDRQHGYDFIDTYWGDKSISPAFASEIGHIKKKYGFKTARGTITDCMTLWRDKVGVSCVNISSGYYNPHTDKELIDTHELWNSVQFIKEIISILKAKRYEHLPIERKTTCVGNYKTTYNKTCVLCNKNYAFKDIDYYPEHGGWVCVNCQTTCNIVPKKYNTGTAQMYCKECKNWKATLGFRWITNQSRYSNVCRVCEREKEETTTIVKQQKCVFCFTPTSKAQGFYSPRNKGWVCFECFHNNSDYYKTFDNTNKILKPEICTICNVPVDETEGSWIRNHFVCNRCLETEETKPYSVP